MKKYIFAMCLVFCSNFSFSAFANTSGVQKSGKSAKSSLIITSYSEELDDIGHALKSGAILGLKVGTVLGVGAGVVLPFTESYKDPANVISVAITMPLGGVAMGGTLGAMYGFMRTYFKSFASAGYYAYKGSKSLSQKVAEKYSK